MSGSESDVTGKEERGKTAGGGWIKRALLSLVIVMVIAASGAGIAAYKLFEYSTREGVAGDPVAFTVPEGASGRKVGRLLAREGFIEHELLFRAAIHADDSGGTIKHGTFLLPRGLSASELLTILAEGSHRTFMASDFPDAAKITVPEGLTIGQAAELVDNSEAFVAAASNPELIRRLAIEAATLEGFLMPNTYFFPPSPSEMVIVERMVTQFEQEYAALLQEHPVARERSKLGIVTVASLVEEEARVDEERAIVAAVIYNRLAKGRPLEMDSTLQFALGKYGQRLLSEDKEVNSPYNTYKRAGLPPGPISNPGVASLRAAMAPADTDYLYFVSNADGLTHSFSRTLKEHNAAVARYRRDIAIQRREQRQSAGN